MILLKNDEGVDVLTWAFDRFFSVKKCSGWNCCGSYTETEVLSYTFQCFI